MKIRDKDIDIDDEKGQRQKDKDQRERKTAVQFLQAQKTPGILDEVTGIPVAVLGNKVD